MKRRSFHYAFCLTLGSAIAGCATSNSGTRSSPPAVTTPATTRTPGPWIDLFDGKTLNGFSPIGTAEWKVENESGAPVIAGGQEGDPKRAGLLRTTGLYKDFEIELEFLIDEHGKYNSGVYLRNRPDARDRTGYQVNIGRAEVKEYTGGIYTDRWLATGDETDAVRKIRDWNHLRIVADGAHIVVDLNGKRVADFTDPAPPAGFTDPGVIAFQTYGAEGHNGFIKFRNLRLRELQ